MNENLGEILRRIEDPDYAAAQIIKDRNRIAVAIREARRRVKQNKARNGGIYIQE